MPNREMAKVYQNLLNENEQRFIAEEMLTMVRLNKCVNEQIDYGMKSWGMMNLLSTTSFIKRFTRLLEQDYGNLTYLNSYTRLHKNESELPIHTDKRQLELTLSVCIFNNTGTDWKFHVSDLTFDKAEYGLKKNQFKDLENVKLKSKSYITPVGSGVTCMGAIHPHWRDPLVCDDKGIIIQTFYHWKFCA